jgi:BCD family chlorophyll transporter-like MFS transporter
MGTAASDVARWFLGSQVAAYSSVFAGEAVLFVVAAVLAARIAVPRIDAQRGAGAPV